MFERLAKQFPGLRLTEELDARGWVEPHSGRLALQV
jgi:hypothetical protein